MKTTDINAEVEAQVDATYRLINEINKTAPAATKSLKEMNARELFAASEAGRPGAREAYDAKRRERDAIKRDRRARNRR